MQSPGAWVTPHRERAPRTHALPLLVAGDICMVMVYVAGVHLLAIHAHAHFRHLSRLFEHAHLTVRRCAPSFFCMHGVVWSQ
jgi:hypothetical protein